MQIVLRIPRHPRQQAFTLVELLVVIAIIGILIALLLPAIQAARESARRNTCLNHLKQMALATLNHNDSMKHLPTAGWGYVWIGDPDRGYGPNQPGGWLFNILPFLEEKNLHDLSKGPPQSQAKKAMAAIMLQTPLDVFNCPTRRPLQTYDTKTSHVHMRTPNYSKEVLFVARTDYAGNGGSVYNNPRPEGGPGDWADASTAKWTSEFRWSMSTGTGVFAGGSVVRLKQITDGVSHTYLCGEKKINPDNYTTGGSANDNETLYMGFNGDIMSWANLTNQYLPEADRAGNGDSGQFGSAHSQVFQMAFCDGSVHRIPYEVDPNVNMNLANRKDGLTVSTSSFD